MVSSSAGSPGRNAGRSSSHHSATTTGDRFLQVCRRAARLVVCNNKPAVTALREIGSGKVAFKEDIDETVRTSVADRKRIDGENRRATQKRK
jgi:hypothetical protein